MSELTGINLAAHLEAIFSEYRSNESIYGYPKKKIWRGFDELDLEVDFFGRKAATPLGPAAGPHSQLAQNIVKSFLGGGRIVELKTIQVLDQLKIPRPCIDVRNVGYNVEWSQELSLDNSYTEYVTAWTILKIIEESELLNIPKSDKFYKTIFNVSVGYDLKGISSKRVSCWLKNMTNAEMKIDRLLSQLPHKFSIFRELNIDPYIAHSVTISTFHGCPPDEIESIAQYLISEHGLNVVVKMNPTVLGYDEVKRLLNDEMGYKNVELDEKAFENELNFEGGIKILKRLTAFAEKYNRQVGAKFTNTLIVKNNQNIFADEMMYLSGAPLHVLAFVAMHEFRKGLGNEFPLSFSAGTDKHNFADIVRCNITPVTTCTDLLKPGGYTRMYDYLLNLKNRMEEQGSRSIEEFIVNSCSCTDVKTRYDAGMINSEQIVSNILKDKLYHYDENRTVPVKIDSRLGLFDCVTCKKCLHVCPNGAYFLIHTGRLIVPYTEYRIWNGDVEKSGEGQFELKKEYQIANIADLCNECGNCDTYCPEYGAPYIKKPRFFLNEDRYLKFNNYDGFYLPGPSILKGRIAGCEYELSRNEDGRRYCWNARDYLVELNEQNEMMNKKVKHDRGAFIINMHHYFIFKVLLDNIVKDANSYASIVLRGGVS